MNNGRLIKCFLDRSALVNDLCAFKENCSFVLMEFSHGLMLKSTAVTKKNEKGTGGSLSEAVFVFTQREDAHVARSKSVF